MSLATEAVLAAEQTGEYAPIRLNHLAYVTHDTAATVSFWTEVMQMPLVEAVMHERVPSTGDPFPYVHFFFRMQDGSTIAFFEAVGLPPRPEPTHPAYLVFDHLALEVGTPRRGGRVARPARRRTRSTSSARSITGSSTASTSTTPTASGSRSPRRSPPTGTTGRSRPGHRRRPGSTAKREAEVSGRPADEVLRQAIAARDTHE